MGIDNYNPQVPEDDFDKLPGEEALMKELSLLDELVYYRQRKDIAEKYKIPLSCLDKYRNRAIRKAESDQSAVGEQVKPWPEEVDGPALLNKVEEELRRYLVLSDSQIYAISLFSLFTYLVEEKSITNMPMLVVSSPVKRCGKTTLLSLLSLLVYKPIMATSITPSALFRLIAKVKPTLIIDEADNVFHSNDDLRTIINGAFNRTSSKVYRTNPETKEVEEFDTWGAKVIALIGSLPTTIEDRSIPIIMRRKSTDEKVERLRAYLPEPFTTLRAMLLRFAADNMNRLSSIDPDMASLPSDRAVDCWRELYRVAALVGGDWIWKAEIALNGLTGQLPGEEDDLANLLSDLRDYLRKFGMKKVVTSASLCGYLTTLNERPWGEINRGKPLTQHMLGRMLRPLRIVPKSYKLDGQTLRGYRVDELQDAFLHYLPPASDEIVQLDD